MLGDNNIPRYQFLKVPDGTLLRYQVFSPLTLSNVRPTILLLHGRASYIERYTHFIGHLCNLGYEVWTFDWRGQGLSTRYAGMKGYVGSYQEYLKDLDLFVRTFLHNDEIDRPFIILGQSMGGHIGLRYMAENPGIAKGAILASPMLDINTGIWGKSGAIWVSRLMTTFGLGKSYVFGHRDYDPTSEAFEGNLLTRSAEMFYRDRHHQLMNPDLINLGVTYGWVDATLRSIAQLTDAEKLKRIKVPIKFFIAGDDRVVDNSVLGFYLENLSKAESYTFAGARHQLLSELPDVRHAIYEGIEQFVTKNFQLPVHKKSLQDVQRFERDTDMILSGELAEVTVSHLSNNNIRP